MSYRCEELPGDILSIWLRPELNETDWTEIERVGSEILEQVGSHKRPRAIVDLTDMKHIGSSLVALLVRIWKVVGERGGQMVVVNNNELVGEVLEIAGLAEKWTIVATRPRAVAILGGNGVGSASKRAGLLWFVVAVTVLVLGGLAVADAIIGGVLAGAIGRVPLLEIVALLGALGLYASGMAAWRGSAVVQFLSVIVMTFSGVLLVLAVLLILNLDEWAGEDTPRVHQVNTGSAGSVNWDV